jgi:hypothetical protein
VVLAAAWTSARLRHVAQCIRRVFSSASARARSAEGPAAGGVAAVEAEAEVEADAVDADAVVSSRNTLRMGGRMCGRRYGGMSPGSMFTAGAVSCSSEKTEHWDARML